MAEPETRRTADPRIVRKIHSAIKKTCEQKQSPIFDRIHRALSIDKVQITRSRIETQLKNAIHDGIIVENNSGNNRNPKAFATGEVKTSYRVPTLENFYENYEDDGHDWYCWVCHREGEVFLCTRCPRVIHKKCAELSPEDLIGDFVCYCCKDLESTKQYGKKEIVELARMLSYTVERMKSKLPDAEGTVKCEELWKSPSEETHPTYKLFVYQDYNLNELEKRVKKKEFDSLAKFHYEIEWLFHNAVIFYGGENKLTELARMVVLDGQNELSQIDICSECYIRSNERMKNWFSIPCKPIHRIVYAKLGSDPPWPAKVLRESEDGQSIDVRFFATPYQRAWIPKRNVWDLDEKPSTKKRSKALIQAEDELKVYLRLMASARNKSSKDGKSAVSDDESNSEEEIDDDEEDEEEEEEEKEEKEEKFKPTKTPISAVKRKPQLKEEDDDDEVEEDEDDEMDGDDDDDDDYDEYVPATKRKKKTDKEKQKKLKQDGKEKKKRGRKKGSKNKSKPEDEKSKGRTTKAERRFRELQEQKMKEFAKNKKNKSSKSYNPDDHISKVDINKNIGGDTEPGDDEIQLAQQIKMTDDYKMIEKLQDRVRNIEKSLEQSKSEYEAAQADLESTRIDLATERQKSKRLQEQVEKGAEINEEKLRNEMQSKKQEEIEAAVDEERKRNELEFESRLNEALTEERNKTESKIQESLDKERMNLDNTAKMMAQRDREELQRNFDRYKSEFEMKHNRTLEETARKYKIESDEMVKRAIQENIRRIQADTERMLAAAKKKSWCSNCTKEAFYHCCWNTNYCSTECQRVHWVTHRYQCTREMMSTCRSCQQRQNFPGSFTTQVPPK